jgi:F0F1-type ATP synthase assembly protein I
MINKQKLVTVLVSTVLAGLGAGYLATRYLGRDTSIAIGGTVFLAGAGLQIVRPVKTPRRKSS